MGIILAPVDGEANRRDDMDYCKEEVHYKACNLCEAICGLEIRTRGHQILSIKGDTQDPLSQGHICPKAIALQDIYNDSDRLRQPVRKTADGWQQISWDDAFTEVVNSLRAVQAKYGHNAVGTYQGNPSVHNLGVMMFAKLFLKQLRTRNRYSATSVDQLPHHIVAGLMFGHEMLIPVPDIDRTQFMLILGANPVVSNGSMMTVPNVAKRLKQLRSRGGKFWVIDPRKTETAAQANEHTFIQPGSDAHLLAAMITTVFEEGLVKQGHLQEHIDNLNSIRTLLAPWTPEKVETITGVDAQTIRRMVREFCEAESAVLYGRMGVSTQEFGTLCQWMIVIFNIITDNFDKAGGAMFTTPAIDILGQRGGKGRSKSGGKGLAKARSDKFSFSFNRYSSRVKALPEMQGELPVTTLVDELLTEGDGQIKAMVVIAGNPVLSTPNGQRFSEALKNLDFMLAVDCYINETSRHAHIILPPTTILEREHYDLVFHALAVRNTARFSTPLFKPNKDALSDAEIFIELASRMQKVHPLLSLFKGIEKYFYKKRGIRSWLDKQLQQGPYGKSHGASLKTLLQNPHGVDFGPLQSCLPARLRHNNQSVVVAPREIACDLPRLRKQLQQKLTRKSDNSATLLLIGRRDPRTCNSWMHNSHRLTKGKARCVAHINPQDVNRLRLEPGTTIRVSSASGSIELGFESTDTIKVGVISIPHGWGHDLPGVEMSCAVEHSGVSVNDLTSNSLYDAVSGNAVLNGVPVRVESAHGVSERKSAAS